MGTKTSKNQKKSTVSSDQSTTVIPKKTRKLMKLIKTDHIEYIISYWIRIYTDINTTNTFPNEIMKLLEQITAHRMLNGKYIYRKAMFGGYTNSMINIQENEFSIQFDGSFDPLAATEAYRDGQYIINATFNGTIDYDYCNYCYVLTFDNKSLSSFVKVFNYVLDNKKRKQKYILRTKTLYSKHNVNVSNITDYNKVTTYNTMFPEYTYHSFFDDDISNTNDVNCKQTATFVDYHDIYTELCNKFNEEVLPIYIVGEFQLEILSRYYLQFYFNDALKWKLYSNDNFKRYQYEELITDSYESLRNKTFKVITKIDCEINYFEIYYLWIRRTLKLMEFKGKGDIINNGDTLKFDKESRINFQKAIKGRFDIDDCNVSVKLNQSTDKITIRCNDKLIWELTPINSHNDYYDYDETRVFTKRSIDGILQNLNN